MLVKSAFCQCIFTGKKKGKLLCVYTFTDRNRNRYPELEKIPESLLRFLSVNIYIHIKVYRFLSGEYALTKWHIFSLSVVVFLVIAWRTGWAHLFCTQNANGNKCWLLACPLEPRLFLSSTADSFLKYLKHPPLSSMALVPHTRKWAQLHCGSCYLFQWRR